ncbi:ABC transporter ATP-binding protein [Chloroflexota bacterium]
MALLEVQNLRTYFYTRRGVVKAVDGVSFTVNRGECVGILGESGCGKSVTLYSILRLVARPAGQIVGGEVLLNGQDLLKLSEEDMRGIRGRQISLILQDPNTSLNPVFTCGFQIEEPLRIHQGLRPPRLQEQAEERLKLVKISDPHQRMANYPHQISGGMRQRVMGAIAMSCEPELLLADEPTTSLDTTVQEQYLSLLKSIQEEKGLALIYVTHSIPVLSRICDRVVVMYAGKAVEKAPLQELLEKPCHPYTQGLIACIPWPDKDVERLVSIPGQPPEPISLPPGCSFAPRCDYVMDRCRIEYPPEVEIGEDHTCSCWKVA